MRSVLLFLRDVLVIFGIAILVSFLVKTFLVRSFFIPSSSMEQTLQIDDRVIVNELVPKAVACITEILWCSKIQAVGFLPSPLLKSVDSRQEQNGFFHFLDWHRQIAMTI